MARILGIDYGTKKIGLALSDEEQKIAFPKTVLANEWDGLERLLGGLKSDEGVSEVVIGLPVGFDGKETALSRDVRAFADKMHQKFAFSIHFENEVYSSAAVKTASGDASPKAIDAASAALILQTFLDRRRASGVIK